MILALRSLSSMSFPATDMLMRKRERPISGETTMRDRWDALQVSVPDGRGGIVALLLLLLCVLIEQRSRAMFRLWTEVHQLPCQYFGERL